MYNYSCNDFFDPQNKVGRDKKEKEKKENSVGAP